MKTTEQQHNARKREMMEKCFECYAENWLMRAAAQRQIFIRISKTLMS